MSVITESYSASRGYSNSIHLQREREDSREGGRENREDEGEDTREGRTGGSEDEERRGKEQQTVSVVTPNVLG